MECGGQRGESSLLELRKDHVTVEDQRQKEIIKERCDEEYRRLTTKKRTNERQREMEAKRQKKKPHTKNRRKTKHMDRVSEWEGGSLRPPENNKEQTREKIGVNRR